MNFKITIEKEGSNRYVNGNFQIVVQTERYNRYLKVTLKSKFKGTFKFEF